MAIILEKLPSETNDTDMNFYIQILAGSAIVVLFIGYVIVQFNLRL